MAAQSRSTALIAFDDSAGVKTDHNRHAQLLGFRMPYAVTVLVEVCHVRIAHRLDSGLRVTFAGDRTSNRPGPFLDGIHSGLNCIAGCVANAPNSRAD